MNSNIELHSTTDAAATAISTKDAVGLLYDRGWSTRRIAAALRISYTTVRTLIRESGRALRPRGGPNNTSKLTNTLYALSIDDLYAHSARALAEHYDVHVDTIRKARRRARQADVNVKETQ